MSSGQSESSLTTKTEFMRFVDAKPLEIRSFYRRWVEYKALYITGNSFGSWMRAKHLEEFSRAYHVWWLRHPALFGQDFELQDLLSDKLISTR